MVSLELTSRNLVSVERALRKTKKPVEYEQCSKYSIQFMIHLNFILKKSFVS